MVRIHPVFLRFACLGWGLLLVSLLRVSPVNAGLAAGDRLEGFSLEESGGGEFHYPADAAGKVVFLNFWASWCPECKAELPELEKIWEKYKGRPFVLLAVNVDRKRKAADKFLNKMKKKVKLDMIILYDNDQKVINAAQPVGIPASYLIGPTGTVEKVYFSFKEGYIEMYERDIEALVERTEGEAAPARAGQVKGTP